MRTLAKLARGYQKICEAIAQNDVASVKTELAANPQIAAHWKPLCDAAFHGNVASIDLLLDAGADPNQKAGTATRHTPLTRVAQYHKTIPRHERHVDAMKLLLDRGAHPSLPAGPLDVAPIVYSTVGPQIAFIDVFRNYGGASDIFAAAALHDLDEIKAMLKDSKSPELIDHQNRTPLHFVCLSGKWRRGGSARSIACAEVLLAHGVAIDAMQEIPDAGEVFHANALWYAVAYSQNIDLIEVLLQLGSTPQPSAFAATYGGNGQIVELLHEHGIDWNAKFGGYTPLLELLNYRKTKLIKWLLDHGASVDERDPDGRTALHIAAMRGLKSNSLQALLDHGAEPKLKDPDGNTPMDLAVANNRLAAAEFLRTHTRHA